jgi:hypothetical protein
MRTRPASFRGPVRTRHGARCALGGALLALYVAACLEPTQVTLILTTNARCPGAAGDGDVLGEVAIFNGVEVTDEELASPTTVTAACEPGSPTSTIGTLVIVPGTASPVLEVAVVAAVTRPDGTTLGIEECLERLREGTFEGTPCIAARRKLSFVDGTPLELPVELVTECVGVECGGDQTCEGARCVSAAVSCVVGGCSSPQGNGGGGAEGGPKRVFVTSETFTGASLGGLSGADAQCNALAAAAGLPGNYRAWLSTQAEAPETRFSRTGPWHLLEADGALGELVASDWDELSGGLLRHAIDRTEVGALAPPTPLAPSGGPAIAVHSATFSNGEFEGKYNANPSDPGLDCDDWTGDPPNALRTFGDATSTNADWTIDAGWIAGAATAPPASACTLFARLYCFEQ